MCEMSDRGEYIRNLRFGTSGSRIVRFSRSRHNEFGIAGKLLGRSSRAPATPVRCCHENSAGPRVFKICKPEFTGQFGCLPPPPFHIVECHITILLDNKNCVSLDSASQHKERLPPMSFIGKYLRHASYLSVLLAMPFTVAANTERLYVVNDAGTTFTEIDPATNKVVRTIGGFQVPRAIHASPDGRRLYVTSGVDHVLDVLDQKTLERIKSVPLDGEPDALEVTKDGKRVLVTVHEFPGAPGALDIVDTTSLTKVKTIVTKSWLHDMALTQDGKYAVVGSPGGDMKTAVVTVFDLQKEEIAWEVQLDRGVTPLAIESNPDGSARRLFLTLEKFNGFSVVDFESHKETARIELPKEPNGYGTGTAQSHGIAIAPDGKSVWVNCEPCNSVFAYSLPELKLLGHVEMPALRMPGKTPTGMPYWVTFAPSGKTVYVAVAVLRQVVAIDPKTMKILTTIPVGEVVDRMTTDVLP